ncbi:MAG TPA: hypothetical protein VGH28_12330 [Polyangiaceae bacterium]|jgi:hypothetical protein
MAWQVLLLRLPDALGSLAELPSGWAPPPLGAPQLVAERIGAAASKASIELDCDGERLIVLRCEDFVIEAELGGVTSVDRVVLRVLGSDAALPLIGSLALELGAAAIDCETDTVLDADAIVPDTLRQWQTRIDDLR